MQTSLSWRCVILLMLVASARGGTALTDAYGRIEVVRDIWGIPHVFADSDAGAMYGLGYATAEERGFQMTYNLRIIQGRLAEVVGSRSRGSRNETAVDNDRKMRTFGWARAAERTAENLDRGTQRLLEAYCDGVNHNFAEQQAQGRVHPLFARLGVVPERWTPADCLLSWWHLAQFFATDGTRDLMVARNRLNPRPGQPEPPKPSALWQDDATSVVQRGDVPDRWVREVEQFARKYGRAAVDGGEGPKFSHAWVVGGRKTTTGAAVLVSDPQTPVRNPSLWIEFHISGKTFNVRGIGVPGSPGLLIGFNRDTAWGLTALGADQADLFKLETDSQHTNEYRWNGKWRAMEVRTEKIKVKGGANVELVVRETHLGPIASEFSFRRPDDPEVALKRVPICETKQDTIQAVFALMRARSARELAAGLSGWRFPSANCIFGDRQGNIGYSVIGAMPMRAPSAAERAGGEAMPGQCDVDDWQGFVPQRLLPHVINPSRGLLFSANHRAVGAFYPISLGTSTGSLGDTIRSWRLRELLQSREQFSPENVLEVHYDSVNAARREIVRLGLHLRDTKQGILSEESYLALQVLEKWLLAGASSDLKSEGASLATQLSTFFRFVATPVAFRYGGGESGLARFLKDSALKIALNPKEIFDDDVFEFIDTILADAWRSQEAASRRVGREPGATIRLGWFDSLDGYGSLDPSEDLKQPELVCVDGQTIRSQAAQSYTQWVPLHDADLAQTICPVGHSDRLDSPFRTSTMSLWSGGKLHPAPLSRKAVESYAWDRILLGK